MSAPGEGAPPSRARRRALLALASAAGALLLAEGALRLCVVESPVSSGDLLGRELPPLRLVPAGWRPDPERHREPRELRGGVVVTRGDLEGVLREDPRLGFAPRESSVSAGGWWQSNALGARRRREVDPALPAGRGRVLLFGDSFAQGHGLPQEETAAARLDGRRGLEVLNFGVSGYGAGQAYLRWQGLPAALEAHAVVLLLVPSADLWREVNVLRSLAGWESYVALPRFALDGATLRLIEPPYRDLAELLADNQDGLSPRLRDHLRAHDRLYDPARYEHGALTRVSVLARLLRGAPAPPALDARQALRPDSEAAQVTAALVAAFRAGVEARGQRFLVAVLPVATDLQDPDVKRLWPGLLELLAARAPVLDLWPALDGAPLDLAYDLSHYGPKVQERLADALEPELRRLVAR